jgi:hypothetical protein
MILLSSRRERLLSRREIRRRDIRKREEEGRERERQRCKFLLKRHKHQKNAVQGNRSVFMKF